MKSKLLLIDPQNDFCDPNYGTLFVPGAVDDMARLSHFIGECGKNLRGITMTLDSHASVAIERTSFWQDGFGKEIAPFTEITLQDVVKQKYRPLYGYETVVQVLRRLADRNLTLTVWPVHCVTGTWGHAVVPCVQEALEAWERRGIDCVHRIAKGSNPLTEHFGAFEAQVPLASDKSTYLNTGLISQLFSGCDTLFVAGEAASHCVQASLTQLLHYSYGVNSPYVKALLPRIVVLTDAMSPIPSYEGEFAKFLVEITSSYGVQCLTTAQALTFIKENPCQC